MPHIHTGKTGERLASDWLTANAFQIIHRNWRQGRYEVDIIAAKEDCIHIIEVKSRTSNSYGPPELSVNKRKIEHFLQGATSWLLHHPGHRRVQYDVLAITLRKGSPPEYVLFEDVYL